MKMTILDAHSKSALPASSQAPPRPSRREGEWDNVVAVRRAGRFARRAVTLMETIIAIGIIIGGLVGVAALIPVAARNAQETLEADRSINESRTAMAAGSVQAITDLDALVIWDKPVWGSVAGGDYLPTDALQTVAWKINTQPSMAAPGQIVGKLQSPGFDHLPRGAGISAGLCIDPLGLPDPHLADQYVGNPGAPLPFAAPVGADSAYNPSRFPYYNETYNPLAPPNESTGLGWQLTPRMWRATVRAPMYRDNPPPVRTHQLLSPVAQQSIFHSTSGLEPYSGEKDGDPASMLFTRTRVGSGSFDASSRALDDYSWFATLVPSFAGGKKFRQSIVVVRQRQAPVPRRRGDPLALQKAAYPIESADDNPAAERLTWIDPLTTVGFRGGAGGDVMIYGSQAVTAEIEPDQWVMLSRQPYDTGTGFPSGPAVHRWYRVLRVGEAETRTNQNWPGGTNSFWFRQITLAGPDWVFEDGLPGQVDDTFCTIISGAISVVESEVELQ